MVLDAELVVYADVVCVVAFVGSFESVSAVAAGDVVYVVVVVVVFVGVVVAVPPCCRPFALNTRHKYVPGVISRFVLHTTYNQKNGRYVS